MCQHSNQKKTMTTEDTRIQYAFDEITDQVNRYIKVKKSHDSAKYTMMVNFGPIGRTVKGLIESEDVELDKMIELVFNYYHEQLNKIITFNWENKETYHFCRKGTYELYIEKRFDMYAGFIYDYYDTLEWGDEFKTFDSAKEAVETKFLEFWNSLKKQIEQ